MPVDRKHRIPPTLLEHVREMRRAQTPAEGRMWSKLKNRQIGFKFRRQAVIGSYITDFVCMETRLVVELDGVTHETSETYDANRTLWLESKGFEVVRFTNEQVNLSAPMQ